ncbi:MAG: RNA polymerase sigma factor [Cellulosilyticaceae bacterium]
MEEKDILEGLRASQVASYEKLIDTYGRYVSAVVCKVGSGQLTREDIEEISADVFIKLWEGREGLCIKEGYLKAYIGRMARNKTLNALRSKHLGSCVPLEEDTITYMTPEEELTTKEEEQLISEVIGELPEPDREIFIRRYFYMEKLGDIAAKIGLPIGTIGTKLARGKKKLEIKLKERGVAYE